MCVAFKHCLVKCCLGNEQQTLEENRTDHTRLVISDHNNNLPLKQLKQHENGLTRAPGGWRKNTVKPMVQQTQISNV